MLASFVCVALVEELCARGASAHRLIHARAAGRSPPGATGKTPRPARACWCWPFVRVIAPPAVRLRCAPRVGSTPPSLFPAFAGAGFVSPYQSWWCWPSARGRCGRGVRLNHSRWSFAGRRSKLCRGLPPRTPSARLRRWWPCVSISGSARRVGASTGLIMKQCPWKSRKSHQCGVSATGATAPVRFPTFPPTAATSKKDNPKDKDKPSEVVDLKRRPAGRAARALPRHVAAGPVLASLRASHAASRTGPSARASRPSGLSCVRQHRTALPRGQFRAVPFRHSPSQFPTL